MRINAVPKFKKSTLQLLVIAMLSVLTGIAIFSYTSGIESRLQASQVTKTVFITLRAISVGTPLGEAVNQGILEQRNFPVDSIPTGAIEKIDANNSNLVALQTLQPGQLLLNANFGNSVANTGALTIPDGQLAVTVSLSDPAKVANFLQPGSEISIFVTGQSNNSKFTQVLIPRAQVLAIGNEVVPAAPGASFTAASPLITVAVTPTQAKRLIHASQTLSLYFGLLTASVDFGDMSAVTDSNLVSKG